jgi:hypothetical protein
MGYDHSACAALFGFCECNDCIDARKPKPRKQASNQSANLDEWHLWTIRSNNVSALSSHRRYMMELGFNTGSIERSRGWAEDCLPPGWFYFSARILKAALAEEDYKSLCAWDRLHGELPNAHALAEERSDDSQQRVVGGKDGGQ